MTSRIAILLPLLSLPATTPLRAQTAPPPAATAQQSADSPVTPFTFDVATFKPSNLDIRYLSGGFSTSGYHVTSFPLSGIVFSAYFPMVSKGHQLIGMPSWAINELYDVLAHVDEATAPTWLKLAPLQRQGPGRLMLQQLLAERCKLVAHLVPAQVDGYVLVVSKSGSRLTPSKPGRTYPPGTKGYGDGVRVIPSSAENNFTETYFNATIEDLVSRLSWDWLIVDRTNLTGLYDFTIRRLDMLGPDGKRVPNPEPYDLWDISATGLVIKHAKVPTQNLVIDHIERPSPN